MRREIATAVLTLPAAVLFLAGCTKQSVPEPVVQTVTAGVVEQIQPDVPGRYSARYLSTNLLRVMHCDHCALLFPDSESGELQATMLYNSDPRGVTREGMMVPIKGSISGRVFRTGKSLRIDDRSPASTSRIRLSAPRT